MTDSRKPELDPSERELFQAFMTEFLEMQKKKTPVILEIDLPTAWALLATIQLACRHPTFDGDTRRIAEDFARTMQSKMLLTPAMAQVAEKGWHKEFDR